MNFTCSCLIILIGNLYSELSPPVSGASGKRTSTMSAKEVTEETCRTDASDQRRAHLRAPLSVSIEEGVCIEVQGEVPLVVPWR